MSPAEPKDESDAAAVADPLTPAVAAAELPTAEGAWSRRTFAALGNRDYRLFFLGMAISAVGTWGRHAAQQWLVWGLTEDETWLSWVSAASLLPIALVSIPAGAVVDRVDKRRLLLALQVIEMALSAFLAVLVGTGRVRPHHVVAIAACLGVAGGVEMPCRQAFVVEMVGKGTLRNAIALNSIMFNLPLMLGPALATVLMKTVGITSVFVIDALSFVASIAAFAWMRVPARVPAPTGDGTSPLREIAAGLAFVRRSRPVAAILALLSVAMVFGWSYASQLAAYAKAVLGAGETGYGLLYASSGVGACVGALWIAGRNTLHPERVLLACLAGFAVSLLAMAAVPNLALAVVSRAVAGWCMISFFTTGNSTIQLAVPDAIRGRVMALWTFAFGTSLPVGQLLIGALARRTSVPFAFGAGAGVVLLAVAAFAVLRPLRGAGVVAPPRPPLSGPAR